MCLGMRLLYPSLKMATTHWHQITDQYDPPVSGKQVKDSHTSLFISGK